MKSTTTETQAKPIELVKPGVFTGHLRQWQMTAFASLVHAGVSNLVAHKIACDYGSDLGRAMANDKTSKNFKTKIGKLGDDGDRSIKFAGMSTITSSDSMSIVYVAQSLDQLFKEKLLASRKLPTLAEGLQEYIDKKCVPWVYHQNWDLEKEAKESFDKEAEAFIKAEEEAAKKKEAEEAAK